MTWVWVGIATRWLEYELAWVRLDQYPIAATAWNSIPFNIRNCDTIITFKCRLKTFLFLVIVSACVQIVFCFIWHVISSIYSHVTNLIHLYVIPQMDTMFTEAHTMTLQLANNLISFYWVVTKKHIHVPFPFVSPGLRVVSTHTDNACKMVWRKKVMHYCMACHNSCCIVVSALSSINVVT